MLHVPRKTLPTYGGATILSLLILALVMQLWRADIAVPFSYGGGDETLHGTLIKGVVDNGWYLHNPFLGMPAGLDLHDFPVGDNFHLVWMKLISFLSLNYAITFNVYFILAFPLTVVTSLYVLRQFSISILPAIVSSLLFAFLPYHFFKGQGHFFLGTYYVVPLIVMVIVWVCMGEFFSNGRIVLKKIFTGIAICIAVGSEIPYYAFFSGFLLLVSGIFSTFRQISIKPLAITVLYNRVHHDLDHRSP